MEVVTNKCRELRVTVRLPMEVMHADCLMLMAVSDAELCEKIAKRS